MLSASFLRMWAGSILTSRTIMAFKVQKDLLNTTGPYALARNPIYLADMIALCGFALCLNPVGLALPLLIFSYLAGSYLLALHEVDGVSRWDAMRHLFWPAVGINIYEQIFSAELYRPGCKCSAGLVGIH